MFTLGIRNRLTFSSLLLVIITLSFFGGYVLWFFYQYNIDVLSSSLSTQAEITEKLIKEYMSDIKTKSILQSKVQDLSFNTQLRITVIDTNGNVLADSWENPQNLDNQLQHPEVATALSGNKGTDIRYSTHLKQNISYAAIPIREGDSVIGSVRIASSISNIEAAFYRIQSTLLLAIFITSIIAIFLSVRLAHQYTAPVEEITRVAKQLAEGRLEIRAYIRTGDELELLAHTLNKLASNLDDKITEAVAETKKMALILQHMDNAVILLDRYGRITTANRKAREIFSIADAMLGQHNIHVIGNSLLDKAVHDTIGQAKTQLIDLKTNIKETKKVFQVFLAPIIVADNEITGVLSVFHDITALQEIYERQADFVANASHELATPLTAIKGFAETLLDGAMTNPELSAKFINIIYTEAERMHRLVKDLLQLAKLNSREYRQEIKMEPTIVSPIIDRVIQEMSGSAKRKNIRLIVDHCPKVLTASANPDWLKQVLVNLIDNSIKYTPNNGTVLVKCWQKYNEAFISVQDTGIGIPQKDLPLIFDRFYRVDRARARTAGGTGLGLAIVKFIVEMHGGKIDVQSEVDVGTTFTFSIPLAN